MDLAEIVVVVWDCDQNARVAAKTLEEFGVKVRLCPRNSRASGDVAIVSKHMPGMLEVDPTYKKLDRLQVTTTIRIRMGAFVNVQANLETLKKSLISCIDELEL
ncbi:hypothetical protein A3A21_01825 [Candidatus Jorgensenbacteria bacterium RIFCSPLOWO2_01_FULL_45_25b]|uniref:Uncharacterized protein n=1 Tax=Candidatus Jorgensenbacteria bacterium RIFCSPLOWO2_01_FULL_45_25b TaxID=1798471 RepID=A0A1F6BTG0_9BACT|nr:MAG: hypothetical protein A3A21_01825 [Candidatus Jorgensenbacteria bacterium RIFCSPLOWO2_01_FULL_45_25b]